MPERTNRRAAGEERERQAEKFLADRGCRLLERNFRSRSAEIDLIYEDNGVICFGEVKYRSSLSHGLPCEAVGRKKQLRICRACDYYRAANGLTEEHSYRFDVISVTSGGITWYKNAFEYTGTGF